MSIGTLQPLYFFKGVFMSKTIAPDPYEDYMDHFSPLEVKVFHHFESDLRRFKALIQKSKVLSLHKEKQAFEKKSDKKRRKRRDAAERTRLLNIKETMMLNGEWDKRQKAKDAKKRDKVERYRKAADFEQDE